MQCTILLYALVRFPATSVVFRPGRICQAKRRVPQPVLGRIHEKCKQETKITPLWRFRVSEIVLSIDSWNLSSSIWYLSVRQKKIFKCQWLKRYEFPANCAKRNLGKSFRNLYRLATPVCYLVQVHAAGVRVDWQYNCTENRILVAS